MTENEIFLPMPLEHSRNIFGQFDIYAKKLERGFHVSIVNRDEGIKIIGKEHDIKKAEKGTIMRPASAIYPFCWLIYFAPHAGQT